MIESKKVKGKAKSVVLPNGREVTYCERCENNPEVLIDFCSFYMAPHLKQQTANVWFDTIKTKGPRALLSIAMRKKTGIFKKMKEMARGSRFKIIPGERHLMELDCPKRVAEEAFSFIDEVKQS